MQLSPKQFLAQAPVFSRQDLREVLSKRNGSVGESTINSHLYSWEKAGYITQVKRGLYARCEKNGKVSPKVDPFVVASKAAPDSVLSHHSALELHGLAQSVFFSTLTFLTLSSVKPFSFEGIDYKPVRPRPKVLNKKQHARWVEYVLRGDTEVPVTSIERTLVDALDRPELVGGVEEAWESISGIPAIRFDDLVEYLRVLDRPVVAARVGFYLESRKEDLVVPETTLKRIDKLAPKSKVYFTRNNKGASRFVSRWNLVVPEALIENGWEGVGD